MHCAWDACISHISHAHTHCIIFVTHYAVYIVCASKAWDQGYFIVVILLGRLSCNVMRIAGSNQMKLQCVTISNLSHFAFYIRESATRKIHQKISFQHASRIFIPISCIQHQVLPHFWSERLRYLHSCWCWHRGLWWLQLDHISHNNPRWLKATSLSQLEQASHTGHGWAQHHTTNQ